MSDTPPSDEPRLRAPQGCLEWAVVAMGVVYLVLLIIFVFALLLR